MRDNFPPDRIFRHSGSSPSIRATVSPPCAKPFCSFSSDFLLALKKLWIPQPCPSFFPFLFLFRLPLTLLSCLLPLLRNPSFLRSLKRITVRGIKLFPSSICTSSSSSSLLPRRRPPDPTDRIAPASLGVFAFNPLKGRVIIISRHRLKIPPQTWIRGCAVGCEKSHNLAPRLCST